MKSKFLKFVLPALAILLAVSLSFATIDNTPSQTGYYDDPLIPGVQSISTDCEKDASTIKCTYQGFQLYDTDDLDNTPNNELEKVL
ncbi:DUF6520 family protein [Hwangdonia sp.]|uniref:DUF6520 family protein n=1 Tax=Hwangdonia sp. TaxID=1883432 RepID=UPI003AB2481C